MQSSLKPLGYAVLFQPWRPPPCNAKRRRYIHFQFRMLQNSIPSHGFCVESHCIQSVVDDQPYQSLYPSAVSQSDKGVDIPSTSSGDPLIDLLHPIQSVHLFLHRKSLLSIFFNSAPAFPKLPRLTSQLLRAFAILPGISAAGPS
jgi:hypothetical protein